MHPARKRRIRLVVALSAALVLATLLVYTSFSASNESVQPSQLLGRSADATYKLTGKVEHGSIRDTAKGVDFRVRDRDGTTSVPVSYSGIVPDPFAEGREVIVTVHKQGATYVGQRDSLITKCPSKFQQSGTQKS
jgi:cytochrome c-type biogenesis protein CcmE